MANFEMIIYTEFDGVEARVTWKTEETAQAVRKFLTDSGVDVTPMARGGVPIDTEFAYIKTEEQYDALGLFLERLQARNES